MVSFGAVASVFVPGALETGRDFPSSGRPELAVGMLAGVLPMPPPAFA